jgi:hypothetical protein
MLYRVGELSCSIITHLHSRMHILDIGGSGHTNEA